MKLKKLRSPREVSAEINIKRVEMMELARVYGMNGEPTVRSSQELDLLINEYLILQHHLAVKVKVKVNVKESLVIGHDCG
ncbi:aspartyl-phosphate phosphatase Spo0E family protein [Peribacillus asahii]|uniref:aspartyl-phosphate phosphatase Spo0E family protein n=1 Tax=Peribacillus asahii TaxID=228899 RepID=UPI0021FE0113|nr:aspartyl-phosphate phosphatase Spo0E family protein [Peribacillus asahii]USK61015.1 aspartyl-phosphate phosphatase Spo0E family protein [Peribacillus asahii]